MTADQIHERLGTGLFSASRLKQGASPMAADRLELDPLRTADFDRQSALTREVEDLRDLLDGAVARAAHQERRAEQLATELARTKHELRAAQADKDALVSCFLLPEYGPSHEDDHTPADADLTLTGSWWVVKYPGDITEDLDTSLHDSEMEARVTLMDRVREAQGVPNLHLTHPEG